MRRLVVVAVALAFPASAGASVEVGVSMEYGQSVIGAYAGQNPGHINPRFVKLVDAMAPRPVFRIGGDSTDWNHPSTSMAALKDPKFIALWQAVARSTHARLIFGVNFLADNPGLALGEARIIVRYFRPWLAAIEIGNEPEYYRHYPYWKFTRELQRMINAVHSLGVPIAGPATGDPSWITRLPVGLEAQLSIVTYHRYPLNNCIRWPGDPHYPTVANLENPVSSELPGVAQMAGRAHSLGGQFRIDELNSVTCEGKWGVSNSPYSRTWIRLMLENAERAGVDAVNIHMWPGAGPNELFTTAATGLRENPIYEGIMDYEHRVALLVPGHGDTKHRPQRRHVRPHCFIVGGDVPNWSLPPAFHRMCRTRAHAPLPSPPCFHRRKVACQVDPQASLAAAFAVSGSAASGGGGVAPRRK